MKKKILIILCVIMAVVGTCFMAGCDTFDYENAEIIGNYISDDEKIYITVEHYKSVDKDYEHEDNEYKLVYYYVNSAEYMTFTIEYNSKENIYSMSGAYGFLGHDNDGKPYKVIVSGGKLIIMGEDYTTWTFNKTDKTLEEFEDSANK